MKKLVFPLFAIFGFSMLFAQHTSVIGKVELTASDTLLFQMDSLYWGEGVISDGHTPILNIQQSLSSGSALADVRSVTFEDGSPFIEDGKLYLSASSRTGGSGIAIVALTLGTGQLEFTGTISPLMSGTFRKISAAHIMYDRVRKVWQVTTPYHNPTDHRLWVASAYNDLRFGITTLDFSPLDYELPTKGDEDCQIFYDSKMHKWVMIYASTRRPDDKGGYILRLQLSKRPDGGFKDYSYQTDVSATGVTTTLIGGVRYVLSGNTRGEKSNRYSVWSYPDMKFVCDLNIDIDDGAWRSWNNVVPVPEGDATRYVMMGFDRQLSTDEDNWTYGNLYFLYSRQRNPGLEFSMKDADGHVIRPASHDFRYRVEDLQFLRRSSRRFAFQDIPLGCIDFQYDVTRPRGNVYPNIGQVDSLQYSEGRLIPFTEQKGEAAILAGIHHPLANYQVPLDDIAEGESRFLYLGSRDGHCAARVIATRISADQIQVSYQGSGEALSLGTFSCGQTNNDVLRICFVMSNLMGRYYCYAFRHCK